jgi:hypothetical protein
MAASNGQAKIRAEWERPDLVRRLLRALAFASRSIDALVEPAAAGIPGSIADRGLVREKFVAETALLLYCAWPVRQLDARLPQAIDAIAQRLIPLARHADVCAAICLDPGQALDHAAGHIWLRAIGYQDEAVDRLLNDSLASPFGPDRLPYRQLEQLWLTRLCRGAAPPGRIEGRLIRDSMLGRPIDALGSTRLDVYGFTHAAMYASDFGGKPVSLPGPAWIAEASAMAGLAIAVDDGDHDLTAEILMTWPMLRRRWPAAAGFAFAWLARAEDDRGFLSGKSFDAEVHARLNGQERDWYEIVSSYHTVYVMALLCAVALRTDRLPPSSMPARRRTRGAGQAIIALIDGPVPGDGTIHGMAVALRADQQDELAPLFLDMILRRAATTGNLALISRALSLAMRHGVTDSLALKQAAALLRRSCLLAELSGR